MASTFMGIEIGKRGVIAHQVSLNTTGHNLSNMNTEGYSRQRVIMSTTDPLYKPDLTREQRPGQMGQGVQVASIKRIRDDFVDDRIVKQMSSVGYYKIREDYLVQIEHVYNEPAAKNMPSLSTSYDEYVKAWNAVSNNPTNNGARQTLRGAASSFAARLNAHYKKILEIQQNADKRVRTNVAGINNLTDQIVKLNIEIKKSKAMGDNPNDLMDKRDLLVEKLAKLADISIQRGGEEDFIVYIGSQHLIQGDKRQKLAVIDDPENEGLAKVVWAKDNREVVFKDGEMKGLLVIRDIEAAKKLRQLNSLAINLTETVNDIHRDGFGMNRSSNNNFFRHIAMTRNARGNYDRNNDGNFDSTVIFKISGLQKLELNQQVGTQGIINLGRTHVNGENVLIRYSSTDTVKDVIERINKSDAGVSAYLNHKGQLTFKATMSQDRQYSDHVIRHIEDSGNFLVNYAGMLKQSGANGAFDWENVNSITQIQGGERYYTIAYKKHAANWFAVSKAINRSIDNIAVRQGTDTDGDGYVDRPNTTGDARNAHLIVSAQDTQADRSGTDSQTKLDHNPIYVEKSNLSFRQFMQFMVRDIGISAQDAKIGTSKENAILKSLEQTRRSISGVNIDEELANMIKFQHGYSASARIITAMDRMLETIIGLIR